MANTHRNPDLEARWRAAVARQCDSGLTISAFCRRERLGESSFYAWRRTLSERDAGQPARDEPCRDTPPKKMRSDACPVPPLPAFVPVALQGDEPRAIVIELRGGRALRLPESIPTGRLVELVHALEAEVRPRS